MNTVYSFLGGTDGKIPNPITITRGGVIFGTTQKGGLGYGTAFQLTPPSITGGGWVKTILHRFKNYLNGDGASPYSAMKLGPNGTLYGTTAAGSGVAGSNSGTVFQLTRNSNGTWSEQILHSFGVGSANGELPLAPVALGKGGVLYGTTNVGGANGLGTVYSLTPPSQVGGDWGFQVLYSFGPRATDGTNPYSGVTVMADGSLYGTTFFGGPGTGGGNGCGTVYKLSPPTPPATVWAETIIQNMLLTCNNYGGMTLAPNGVFYGGTQNGAPGHGTVFQVTP